MENVKCLNVKNVYTFGSTRNNGFSYNTPTSINFPAQYNSKLSTLLFNGTESYRMTTGIQANNVSVKIHQISSGYYVMYYILEYFNTTTSNSIGQMILVNGYNPNPSPPAIFNLPQPMYIYTSEGKMYDILNSANRISNMVCLFSCLILTSDGKVFVRELIQYQTPAIYWTETFILGNYTDPDTMMEITDSKIVDIQVVGSVNCQTYFAVTNHGHVFSFGCYGNGARGTSSSYAYNSINMIPSLRNIVSISGTKGYDPYLSAVGAIASNGSLSTWGSNTDGLLGWNDSSITESEFPRVVNLPSKVKKIQFGVAHAMVILDNGAIYVFGSNGAKQCDPNFVESAIWVPRNLTLFNTNVTECVPYDYVSSCIVNGTLYSWGNMYAAFIGHSSYGPNFDKIEMNGGGFVTKVTYSSGNGVALTAEGLVYVWGLANQGILALGDEKYVQYPTKLTIPSFSDSNTSILFARSNSHCSIVISRTGNVTSFNYWGECLNNLAFGLSSTTPTVESSLSSIFLTKEIIGFEMNGLFACLLVSNGDLYAWGYPDTFSLLPLYSNPTVIYSNVTLFACTENNIVLVLKNGSVLAIGDNAYYQLGLGLLAPTYFTNFTILDISFLGSNETISQLKLSSDIYNFLILTNQGNVYGCGNNGVQRYLSTLSNVTIGNFVKMNGNIKVREIITGGLSPWMFISTTGKGYYYSNGTIPLSLPSNDSNIVYAAANGPRYYLITNRGNLYVGGTNNYFETSPKPSYTPSLTSPDLYPQELYEGIPYLVIPSGEKVTLYTKDLISCFGISLRSESVCSSHGYCASSNHCVCNEGYFGKSCEYQNCFGNSGLNNNQMLASDVFCKKINKILK